MEGWMEREKRAESGRHKYVKEGRKRSVRERERLRWWRLRKNNEFLGPIKEYALYGQPGGNI